MPTMKALTFYGATRCAGRGGAEADDRGAGRRPPADRSRAICGTDLHPYHGRLEIEDGFVLGHEYMGTIEDKGDGVTQFEEGDRAVGLVLRVLRQVLVLPPRPADEVHGDPRVRARLSRSGTSRGAVRVHARPRGGPDASQDARRTASATRTCCSSATSSRPATTRCARPTCNPVTSSRWSVRPGRALHRDGGARARRRQGRRRRHGARAAEARGELGAIPVNPKETDAEDVVLELTEWRGADVVVDAVGTSRRSRRLLPARAPGRHDLPAGHVRRGHGARCRSATCG